tara:strand:+ start:406 stop:714 length:309 start_codon:yes stop_codon:yes gene_type:complete
MNTREPKDQEDFNYKFIKVLLKTTNKEYPTGIREILLPRAWIQKKNMIPHFANVTRSVGENEGVEITMNCNEEAFDWIIEVVKMKSNYHEDQDKEFVPLSEA